MDYCIALNLDASIYHAVMNGFEAVSSSGAFRLKTISWIRFGLYKTCDKTAVVKYVMTEPLAGSGKQTEEIAVLCHSFIFMQYLGGCSLQVALIDGSPLLADREHTRLCGKCLEVCAARVVSEV